jgi:hypothetical protein
LASPEDEETTISEISITPDGRIYVFGASYEVLKIIEGMAAGDSDLRRRVAHIRSLGTSMEEKVQPACFANHMTSDATCSLDEENL